MQTIFSKFILQVSTAIAYLCIIKNKCFLDRPHSDKIAMISYILYIGGHLGQIQRGPFQQNFVSPTHRAALGNLTSINPLGARDEKFEIVDEPTMADERLTQNMRYDRLIFCLGHG